MRAIELADQYQWSNLWLECDSALVVNAFTNHHLIPWKLRNRWENCLNLTSNMNLLVTHVYREGNGCVNALANYGLNVNVLTVWLEIPAIIRGHFARDRLGLPNFRFTNP
jgi:ribonuclease HI